MTRIIYEVVEHDDGWAYKLDDVFSETFPTRQQAQNAAERAAAEHKRVGEDEVIEYQGSDGAWHRETARGTDRPETEIDTASPLNPKQ